MLRAISLSLLLSGLAVADPFAVNTNGHGDPSSYRVTTFANNLHYPTSMQKLSDGSLLVATNVPNPGGSFYNSVGQIVRFTDANNDGVADGGPQLVANNLPAGITSIHVAGNILFANSGASETITVLRTGATSSDPMTTVGSINFSFPAGTLHESYGLAVQATAANTFDVYFNLGSRNNSTNDGSQISASGLLSGNLNPESIYAMSVTDNTSSISISNVRQIASGLRNSVGMAFADNGDFYLADNGIDGLVDSNEPLSADELNRIDSASIGGAVEDFGFAGTYTEYRTGNMIGSSGIAPLIAFQPIPSPNGSESEGSNEIAIAPSNFGGLSGGVLVSFHGKFNFGGIANEENPLVWANPSTGEYFHFISNDLADIGHIDGLFSTSDSLFVSDLTSNGSMFSTVAAGSIYQITYLPEPCVMILAAPLVMLMNRSRRF